MNTIAYFEIPASNPEKAITFYQNVFSWKFFKEELLSTIRFKPME